MRIPGADETESANLKIDDELKQPVLADLSILEI